MRAALAEASPARPRPRRPRAETPARARRRRRRGAILGLVSLLAEDFAAHENPNRRKAVCWVSPRSSSASAGTARLAAAPRSVQRATRVVATSEKRLVARAAARGGPPVLAAVCDLDARVRYYACEAMYNIVKTARGGLLLLTESRGDDDDFFYDEN